MTVLARGRSAEGDEWQLVVVERPGMMGLVTSTLIRVVSAGGTTTSGGYSNQSLEPGERFAWDAGRDDQDGPNSVILRLARDVTAVRVRLSDGRVEEPDLVDHPVHPDARVAGLVFPRALGIAGVDLLDANGTVTAEVGDIYLFDLPRPKR